MLSISTARYSQVSLHADGRSRRRHVHSLVMEAFVGPRPSDLEVCHCDGDRTNNHLTNLRYDSRQANAADRAAHGRDVYVNRARTKSECVNGHPWPEYMGFYVESVNGKRHRRCLGCDRERRRVK